MAELCKVYLENLNHTGRANILFPEERTAILALKLKENSLNKEKNEGYSRQVIKTGGQQQKNCEENQGFPGGQIVHALQAISSGVNGERTLVGE